MISYSEPVYPRDAIVARLVTLTGKPESRIAALILQLHRGQNIRIAAHPGNLLIYVISLFDLPVIAQAAMVQQIATREQVQAFLNQLLSDVQLNPVPMTPAIKERFQERCLELGLIAA